MSFVGRCLHYFLLHSVFFFYGYVTQKKRGDIEVIRADHEFDRNVPIESEVSDFCSFGVNRRLQGEIGYWQPIYLFIGVNRLWMELMARRQFTDQENNVQLLSVSDDRVVRWRAFQQYFVAVILTKKKKKVEEPRPILSFLMIKTLPPTGSGTLPTIFLERGDPFFDSVRLKPLFFLQRDSK